MIASAMGLMRVERLEYRLLGGQAGASLMGAALRRVPLIHSHCGSIDSHGATPTNNQLDDRVVPSVVVRDLLLRQLLRVAHHFIGRDDRSAAGPFRRWQPPLQTLGP